MEKSHINLLIDRGNSFCKLATATNGIISPIAIYQKLTPEILEQYFSKSCVSSVSSIYCQVGTADEKAIEYLARHSVNFVKLESKTRVPLTSIRYDREKLGADRLALAVGAFYLYPNQASLIIDIGTAITYDFIDAEGNYLGGDISAGPRTRSRSLTEATAELPEVDFMISDLNNTFADTTVKAIANGITRGIIAEIESYIQRASELSPTFNTIITGGYGPFFANRIKNKTFAIPNLLMVGLNKILQHNDNKE